MSKKKDYLKKNYRKHIQIFKSDNLYGIFINETSTGTFGI